MRGQLSYRYDAAGNVMQLVTPAGAVSAFTPTVSSARASFTPPDGGSYTYTYDKERKLKSVTAPSGTTITNTYTNGFLTSVTGPDLSISLFPGRCGKLFGAARGSETASFTYDGSLLTSDVRRGAMPAALGLTYDTDFRPASLTYAGGTDTYAYDADGLLTGAGAYTISRAASSGLPVSVTATDTSLMRSFTGYGELAGTTLTVAGASAYAYALTRDASGRITGRTEGTGASAHTWTYTYDALGRLASATRDGTLAESYAYDAGGNRTAERVPLRGIEETASATFDAADRITASSLATFATDVDGRVSSKTTASGTTAYHYSSAGELTGADLPYGRHVTYTLDAFGRRTSRSVDGSVTDGYLWADATHLLAVYNADSTLRYRFRYADGRVPVAVETSVGVFTLASDQTGSLRAIVGTDGTLLREVTRDSFGALVSDTNPGLDVGLGFAGGLTDVDTGLVHFGAREYDAELGRFTTRDPIDFAGGDSNLYAYCLGDPVNWIAPRGREFEEAEPPAPYADPSGESDYGLRDPYLPDNADPVADEIPAAASDPRLPEAVPCHERWEPGDPTDALTQEGNCPSRSTVSARAWKNEAFFHPEDWTPENLTLMRQGHAPIDDITGEQYNMHHIRPLYTGGDHSQENLYPLLRGEHVTVHRSLNE